MESENWYVYDGVQQDGPMTEARLRARAAAGTIRPTDYVWQPGMADWTLASQMAGLFDPQTGFSASTHAPTSIGPLPTPIGPLTILTSLDYAGFWKRFAAVVLDEVIPC